MVRTKKKKIKIIEKRRGENAKRYDFETKCQRNIFRSSYPYSKYTRFENKNTVDLKRSCSEIYL